MDAHPVILIAEDNENDIFMLRRAFTQLEIDSPIFIVSDGEQAISYLHGDGKYSNRAEYPLPDLLLLDLKMPRMGRTTGFGTPKGFLSSGLYQSHPTETHDLNLVANAYRLGVALRTRVSVPPQRRLHRNPCPGRPSPPSSLANSTASDASQPFRPTAPL